MAGKVLPAGADQPCACDAGGFLSLADQQHMVEAAMLHDRHAIGGPRHLGGDEPERAPGIGRRPEGAHLRPDLMVDVRRDRGGFGRTRQVSLA